MASLIRSADWAISRCTWRVKPLTQPAAEVGDPLREVALRLAPTARDEIEPADGEHARQQQAGHVGDGTGEKRDHQRAEPSAPTWASAVVAKVPCTSLAMARASASRS